MNPRALPLTALALLACDPYRAWPEEGTVFPWVYTPEQDLEEWEEVRWETGTWDPYDDPATAGLYLRKALEHRPGAPEESLEHFETMRDLLPPLAGGVTLSFVGDAMWVGDNWDSYATGAEELLDGELRVGNLETPTSTDHSTVQGDLGTYAFNAPPEMLDGLPLDLLQLNNNHSIDAEDLGLENTMAELEVRGLLHTGVDQHSSVGVGGLRVAFLSYTWGLNQRDATSEHELFIIPFGHIDEEIDLSGLEADIETARADGADSVVVMTHWGFEYEYYPDPWFMVLGRRIVAAGADLVVGQGPHVVQPPEICHVNQPEHIPGQGSCSVTDGGDQPRTAAILYSLGNFGTDMPTVPCQVGLVATVSMDPDLTGLGWAAQATVQGEQGPEILALDDMLEDPDLADEAARLEEHLGASWRR
jgi:poly-gamma-glutamate synthesis protein (capsule biosynthesis protein)